MVWEFHDDELAARERDSFIRRNGLTGLKPNFDESGVLLTNRMSSRFVGVHRNGKKWSSHFRTPKAVGKKWVNLGNFDDDEEAAIAYNNKVTELGLNRKMKLNPINPVTGRPIPKY